MKPPTGLILLPKTPRDLVVNAGRTVYGLLYALKQLR